MGTATCSDVIAGIDRSLDPTRTRSTDDAVDVINLSVGASPGSANDPLVPGGGRRRRGGRGVCRRRREPGRLLHDRFPGTSRRAITVGASDLSDTVASFSRSVLRLPMTIKPTTSSLRAWTSNRPGRERRPESSRAPRWRRRTWPAPSRSSGRSIPTWSPEEIKGALMNNAVTVSSDPFRAGAGRIDALGAGTSDLIITPGSVSFGNDPMVFPTWSRRDTLRVANRSAAPRSVALSVSGSLPSGVQGRARSPEPRWRRGRPRA